MMDRIIRRVQARPALFRRRSTPSRLAPEHTNRPTRSAPPRARSRDTIGAAAIVSYTTSGATACAPRASGPTCRSWRSPRISQTARRLALLWGVHCVHTRDVTQLHRHGAAARCASRIARASPSRGQRVVITAGVPFGTPGATNVLRIAWVEN